MLGPEGHIRRALQLFELRRYRDCVTESGKAIEATPEEPEGYLLLSHGYAYQPGKTRLALEAAEKAISLAPERSDLLAWYAAY